jgi:CRISPR-associated endoribonuclease Cas6/Csy4 subtype I-F
MQYYFDLEALPNPQIAQVDVVAQLMQQAHAQLPQYLGRVGLSFPEYRTEKTLGRIIRVFANDKDLTDLHSSIKANPRFSNYCTVGEVLHAPEEPEAYTCFVRVQPKGNSRLQRLKRRHQAKGTWTNEFEQEVEKNTLQRNNYPTLACAASAMGKSSFYS